MERKNRLNRTTDIQRVREKGKSHAHPLFVLITLQEDEDDQPPLFGVIATKSVGGAVERNHAKRLLREAIDAVSETIPAGCKVLLIARKAINQCDSVEVKQTLEKLLVRAGLR